MTPRALTWERRLQKARVSMDGGAIVFGGWAAAGRARGRTRTTGIVCERLAVRRTLPQPFCSKMASLTSDRSTLTRSGSVAGDDRHHQCDVIFGY
ncbi:hypothetical protein EVAR_37471_1 [Eumeta japonica]|uniref:Uncharacterized protein n=1 Tax=Eumeta variegata TaxID=151549 RepID=A0A4C1XG78_EUMVA|nr:hypothetical protein EVAR_37471_1 [Eumeta japonica]